MVQFDGLVVVHVFTICWWYALELLLCYITTQCPFRGARIFGYEHIRECQQLEWYTTAIPYQRNSVSLRPKKFAETLIFYLKLLRVFSRGLSFLGSLRFFSKCQSNNQFFFLPLLAQLRSKHYDSYCVCSVCSFYWQFKLIVFLQLQRIWLCEVEIVGESK